jgi:hypothetical protein
MRVFLGTGTVSHSRHEGAANRFRYPTFFLHFNCGDESGLHSLLRKKFAGFLSLRSSDYLRGGRGLFLEEARSFLRQNCGYEADEIWLQTLPRMFGYVFNPVSFWPCRRAGRLEAVLVEVNNTFGERHFYWIRSDDEIRSEDWFEAQKVFHVSPFFPVDGFYRFRFSVSGERSRIDINY